MAEVSEPRVPTSPPASRRCPHPSPTNAKQSEIVHFNNFLQRHIVQVPKAIHAAMVSMGKIRPLCDDSIPVLVHPQNDCDSKLGLRLPDHADHADHAGAFIV